MKRFLLTMLLAPVLAYAQDEIMITASKKVSKEVTPQQIVDSLEKRFPNAEAVEFYQTPSSGVSKGWAVSEEDNLEGGTIDYYTLSFKKDGMQYYGLYNANGTLVRSKFEEKNAELPDPVKDKLKSLAGEDYKDYELLYKNYFKTVDHKTMKEYYEVKAVNKKKGGDKKTVILDPSGNVIKTRG